ncbi:hypothetical protein [Paucibacter sp. XJ19-41]|uniref:hypothetical protein n=1 Tax=Paucibacter sp. XJ19-41 TaxID=2927824 RepID=UPI002349E049|nr:hypothetical protein [Paucibacter sp. XJ19-41]MDC6170701.1 hypothetical protein [Paucibacter sp. XJ19-41]
MAEQLKQQHDILVLKVQRGTDEQPDLSASVRITLQGRRDGKLADLHVWLFDADELRLEVPKRRRRGEGAPPWPCLPDRFKEELQYAVRHVGAIQRPLWIHMVKPYGALRWLAWERELIPYLNVPVLMLPDFIFPPPREASAALEVALCASAPLGWEHVYVHRAVDITMQALLVGSPRPTRVHVFADAELLPELRVRWKRVLKSGQVVIHDPQEAAPFVQSDLGSRVLDHAGLLRSPWLLWMRQTLRPRAVDVVHFCCYSRLAKDRGTLLFAQSPLGRSDDYLAGPVGLLELQTFMTQIGAWATCFELLADDSAEGLRALADEVAQSRPGPMMMHDHHLDPSGSAIADGYRFLFGPPPQQPPQSQSLFLYCQPYLVHNTLSLVSRGLRGAANVVVESLGPVALLEATARNPQQALYVAAAERQLPTDAMWQASQNGNAWVSSTERLAEAWQLQYQKLARDELMPGGMAEQMADDLSDTLQTLRGAVAALAKQRGELP